MDPTAARWRTLMRLGHEDPGRERRPVIIVADVGIDDSAGLLLALASPAVLPPLAALPPLLAALSPLTVAAAGKGPMLNMASCSPASAMLAC